MSSGTYTKLLNYATNFNVPLLIHIVVCSGGLNEKIKMKTHKEINTPEKIQEGECLVSFSW